MTQPSAPTVVAYDGSPAARAAIEAVARMFADRPAIVVTVWTSAEEVGPAGLAAVPSEVVRKAITVLDAAAAWDARRLADEGAALASAHGLDARAEALGAHRSTWGALVRFADEVEAGALAIGSRGRSSVVSALLGSVSRGVAQHARQPVLLVHEEPGDG